VPRDGKRTPGAHARRGSARTKVGPPPEFAAVEVNWMPLPTVATSAAAATGDIVKAGCLPIRASKALTRSDGFTE